MPTATISGSSAAACRAVLSVLPPSNTKPPEHETLFSDWLWFDVEGESGCSIGELYLQENGPYLDTASRNCLEALSRSGLGIYEAIGSSYMHLLVRDLATGLEQAVLPKEPLEFDNSATILLLGRLAQLPEDKCFRNGFNG